MKNCILSQIYYKYGIGCIYNSVEYENWRSALGVRNNRKFRREINVWDSKQLLMNICVLIHVTNKW